MPKFLAKRVLKISIAHFLVFRWWKSIYSSIFALLARSLTGYHLVRLVGYFKHKYLIMEWLSASCKLFYVSTMAGTLAIGFILRN